MFKAIDYTTESLDYLADEIARGKAYLERLIARGMDTSGVARQVENSMARAEALCVDFTCMTNKDFPRFV